MVRFRPVKQQFHHDPANGSWGDCFRACLASLLGLPLGDVPHFMDKGVGSEAAGVASRAWLGARGLMLVEIPMTGDLDPVLSTVEHFNPGLRFMLSGHSRTGCDHCVICQGGRIIHDPSLTDAGIVGPCQGSEPHLYWISFLSPVEPQITAPAPVVEEPRVPRRPPLGGDPMRPANGERLPPGRYHP